jgi:flagellar assembly protein FliH
MGLIKSSNVSTMITSFSMADIESQARALLVRAQQQADQLLAAAQAEADNMIAAAKAEGLAEGKREGTAQGLELGKQTGEDKALAEHRAEFQQAIAALSAAAGVLDAQRGDLESAGLREVVSLAIAIARRVTKRQGLLDPQVLSSNLEQAMRLVLDAANVRVAIHPEQRKTLETALPALQLSLPSLKHVEIIDDATISPGGCRVFTLHGQIDADLDVQLDRVIADLLPSTHVEMA